MAIKQYSKLIPKRPFTLIGSLSYLKKIAIFIWFTLIIFSIWSAYSDGGILETVNYLGGEIATPTFLINNQSQQIIQQGGVYVNDAGFFSNIWDMLKTYGGLLFAILNLLIWLRFYKILVTWLLTGDTSRVTSNWTIAITIFFIIQLLFIAIFHLWLGNADAEALKIPYQAFINLIKAVPYLLPF